MSISIDLSSKSVIVTGSGQGIGRETAIHFGRAGASVTVADLNLEAAEETAALVEKEGARAIAVRTDVTQYADAEAAVQATVDAFGKVDVLVNNAATWVVKLFKDLSVEDFQKELQVTYLGTIHMCKAVIEPMRAQGEGAIVNLLSDSARVGEPYFTGYGAAKGGVMSFTKGLAKEAARYGVRVNGVSPGTTRTPGSSYTLNEKWGGEERVTKSYPLGRLGEPIDQANAILFFASDLSSWVTGQVLSVNGGFSMVD